MNLLGELDLEHSKTRKKLVSKKWETDTTSFTLDVE